MARPGKDLEQAIASFWRHRYPSAKVTFDTHVEDRHTGARRQVDGWIDVDVGHLRLQVLISCKDLNRPLGVSAIETADGERNSTRAHSVVLYSSSGFTKNALVKANELAVTCCEYYAGRPPNHPQHLLVEAYLAAPIFFLGTRFGNPRIKSDVTWRNVLPYRNPKHQTKGSNALRDAAARLLDDSFNDRSQGDFAPGKCVNVPFDETDRHPAFTAEWLLAWDWYKGLACGFKLSGVFDHKQSGYVGGIDLPAVDLSPANANQNWLRIPTAPIGSRLAISQYLLALPTLDGLRVELSNWPLVSRTVHRFGHAGIPTETVGGWNNLQAHITLNTIR